LEGAKWGGSKLGVNPILLILGAIALGYVAYRLQPEDRRGRIRTTAARLGKTYLEGVGNAMEQHALAERAVNAQLVPRTTEHSAESRVMHELARHDEPMTAQEIYDAAGFRNEVSVRRVREILSTHESSWKCADRGRGPSVSRSTNTSKSALFLSRKHERYRRCALAVSIPKRECVSELGL